MATQRRRGQKRNSAIKKKAPATLANAHTAVQAQEQSSASLVITRDYPSTYWGDIVEWLPKRASLEITIVNDRYYAKRTSAWQIEITLTSGPNELYAYFPFCAYVYLDDVHVGIAEFGAEHESQTLSVTVPTNRPCSLLIVSELADRRSEVEKDGEQRELALVLRDIRLGSEISYRDVPVPNLAIDDHISQWRTALVKKPAKPIFVIGPYRSGTSILTWAIGQHPNIWPLEETGWLQVLAAGARAGYALARGAPRSYFAEYGISLPEYMAHVGAGVDHFLRTTSARYLEKLTLQRLSGKIDFGAVEARFQLARSLFGQKGRWVDGTPENAGNASLLRALFPLAKFICIVRHPFDVITSMVYMERTGGKSMTIDQAGAMWRRLITASIQSARAYGPAAVKFIQYEALAQTPSAVLGDIFEFLREPQFPTSADVYKTRINTSLVTEEERREVRSLIDESDSASQLLDLYKEALTFVTGSWTHDPNAALKADEANQDLIDRVLRQFA